MNRNGFAIITILLIVLIAAIVGGIAYVHYIYLPQVAAKHNSAGQVSSGGTVQTTTTGKISGQALVAADADWKTYTNSTYKFSLQYPFDLKPPTEVTSTGLDEVIFLPMIIATTAGSPLNTSNANIHGLTIIITPQTSSGGVVKDAASAEENMTAICPGAFQISSTTVVGGPAVRVDCSKELVVGGGTTPMAEIDFYRYNSRFLIGVSGYPLDQGIFDKVIQTLSFAQ